MSIEKEVAKERITYKKSKASKTELPDKCYWKPEQPITAIQTSQERSQWKIENLILYKSQGMCIQELGKGTKILQWKHSLLLDYKCNNQDLLEDTEGTWMEDQ